MKRQSETVAGAARLIRITVAAFAAVALAGLAPEARAQAPAPKNIFDLSLEDLMNVDVTSVSKKDQTLAKTGAAVFVINREDIRRSGAANIPDVLRMAPGVEVAQVNANQWAISIRGFNAIYSNKVLVLIDGRAVYVDQFSGVYWDQVDVPLEDIERIEVIRGPGGTVWGANAVNGVINIITRSAADTKGALVAASAGTRQTAAGLVQYGADAGSTGAWRIFGKYFNDDDSPLPGGRQAPDGAHSSHAGFRIDQSLSSRDTLSVQGDFITSSGGETTSAIAGYPPAQASFNNLLQNSSGDGLARWEHTQANGSEFSLQISDSDFSRHESGVKVTDNALDIEFEHHLHVGDRHDIVWGLDYRSTAAGIYSAEPWSFQVHPPHRVDNLLAGFVQDEIRIAPSLFLTVGSKIEHNDFTGVEFEPGVQLVWAKSARQSVWASASRAVREPDVFERYIQYPLGLVPVPGVGNALLVLEGNPAVGAEHLTDFEVGYRSQLNSRTSIDLTGFLSYYNGIETNEPGAPYVSLAGGGPSLVLPLSPANLGKARDYGIELFGNWQATRHWKISPGLSVLRMSIGRDPGSNDASILQTPGNSPRQQFEIRSLLNLSKNLEWDSSFKYVADLAAQNIAGYARLDTRLGWKFGEHTEISVSGQNLTSPRHFEFFDNSGLLTASEAARSVFGKLTWRY